MAGLRSELMVRRQHDDRADVSFLPVSFAISIALLCDLGVA